MSRLSRALSQHFCCGSALAAAYRSIAMSSSLGVDADMSKTSVYDSFRQSYSPKDFLEKDLKSNDPVEQFDAWFKLACDTRMEVEPNAAALATSTREGRPSVRYVLLKGYDKSGFRFFTNYNSRKGQELSANPFASMAFYWPVLHRQIRIEGTVTKLTKEESSQYFHSRPKATQIGACVSHQSEVIASRQVLIERRQQLEKEYQDPSSVVPKPEDWGGFLIVPEAVEFWQGHSDRLHDRLRYQRVKPLPSPLPRGVSTEDSQWTIERLSP